MTVPLSPGRQAQPDGTLIPDERVGQATAVHVKDVGKACEKPEQADDDDVTGENPGEQMGATGDPFVEPTVGMKQLAPRCVSAGNDCCST